MSDGFLGRWSRRKLDARDGKPLSDAAPAAAAQEDANAMQEPAPSALAATSGETSAGAGVPPVPEKAVPLPTLDDVQALTAESDFARFAARDVAPEVKNAALKKLFADPRYNVMDGMDVYVDDYSKPDPLPGHMLRRLATAATLKLFEDPASAAVTEDRASPLPRDVADNPKAQTMAQSGTESAAAPEPYDDDDTDLRLQQDDAAAGVRPPDGAA